jgi:hypothetical protein
VAVELCEWIDINSLGGLDAAVCSVTTQTRLTEILVSTTFTHRSMCALQSRVSTVSHISWLINRKVKLRKWCIHCDIEPLLATTLVCSVGGPHVRSVVLTAWLHETIEPILQGILGEGNSLTELRLEICHCVLFSWSSQFRYASNLQVHSLGCVILPGTLRVHYWQGTLPI